MRQRDMCFFGDVFFSATSTSQHHNVVLQHTHFHTYTHAHTHTHTYDWPTVADRSSGSRYFSGFANNFDPKKGCKKCLTARGSRNIRKYFQSVKNVSFVYVYFDAGIMLHLPGYVR